MRVGRLTRLDLGRSPAGLRVPVDLDHVVREGVAEDELARSRLGLGLGRLGDLDEGSLSEVSQVHGVRSLADVRQARGAGCSRRS